MCQTSVKKKYQSLKHVAFSITKGDTCSLLGNLVRVRLRCDIKLFFRKVVYRKPNNEEEAIVTVSPNRQKRYTTNELNVFI